MTNIFSPAGFSLIRTMESRVLIGYADPVTGTPTIGYGHTGPEVYVGLVWTPAEAEAALESDIASFGTGVADLLDGVALGDNQFSAFTDLAYNVGLDAFASSSALATVRGGTLTGIPAHIRLWNEATVGGTLQIVPGLVGRRWCDSLLWRTPDAAPIPDFAAVREAAVASYLAGTISTFSLAEFLTF